MTASASSTGAATSGLWRTHILMCRARITSDVTAAALSKCFPLMRASFFVAPRKFLRPSVATGFPMQLPGSSHFVSFSSSNSALPLACYGDAGPLQSNRSASCPCWPSTLASEKRKVSPVL